ncbi:MAG: hypothetical protein WD990_07465 [Acidimicrobiia bacterium]
MSEPTERQVLYALVAAAWFVVVAVLAVVAAVVGLSPTAWTITFAGIWFVAATLGAVQWRRTARLLLLSVAVFVLWAAGTLVTR